MFQARVISSRNFSAMYRKAEKPAMQTISLSDCGSCPKKIPKPTKKRIIADPELCIGCITCQLICSLSHEGEFNPTRARLHIARDPFEGTSSPSLCRHCTTPACYYACPIDGAMVVDKETGAVVINEKKCKACGKCADACLLDMIAYSSSRNVYLKCDLCGGDPKCVAWCPANALRYVLRRE